VRIYPSSSAIGFAKASAVARSSLATIPVEIERP